MYRNGYGPIDRFCARHPRFGISNLIKYIVIAQAVIGVTDLLAGAVTGYGIISSYLSFNPVYIFYEHELWRLVTWLFVPNSSNPFYLLLGCYFYYWIGTMLEREWGTAKFSLFYLCGAVLSVVLGLILGAVQIKWELSLGAAQLFAWSLDLSYYLNLSIFLIIATLYGEMQVMLFFVVPVKMKWMAIVDVVLIVVDVFKLGRAGVWALALAPLASFINYFIFTWPFWAAKLGMVRRRTDPQVINFKKAQRQAQKKARETGGYMHKCAVCGITDADDPDMEFRYCSKCDGYYCYCANHINNHIHIHED